MFSHPIKTFTGIHYRICSHNNGSIQSFFRAQLFRRINTNVIVKRAIIVCRRALLLTLLSKGSGRWIRPNVDHLQ